ncbi:sigma-54-dependent Fis family transcriptional regulator [candidate division WOR-3 bacterium]|nr:sigma-54-dependent Fis family transcriptional regulator [candidate division WOR-3 bacterium]
MTKDGVLIVDDEENMCRILSQLLTRDGYMVYAAGNAHDALKLFRQHDMVLVITDLVMPGVNGLILLSKLKEIDPSIPVIMVTAYGTVDTAVEAMKKGAYDYVLKPFDNDELLFAVRKAISSNKYRRSKLYRSTPGNLLIGSSEKIAHVYEMIDKIADSMGTVLIYGETGTGKELVAREIHNRSTRSDGPFISVNCAALPDTLLESELFGYEKGAFTGAINSKPGRFELAGGGIIFLDEIGDMSILMQTKVLRVLQDKTITRLGGTKSRKVDVRITAATNKNIESACKESTFRQDLYYRINVLNLTIPPLREHKEDILDIAEYFVEYYCKRDDRPMKKLSAESSTHLLAYDWPGNVRELENAIERAVVLSTQDKIKPEDLGLQTRIQGPKNSLKDSIRSTTAEIEKQAIMKALKECKGNRSKAARKLGISRRTIINKIKLYKIM